MVSRTGTLLVAGGLTWLQGNAIGLLSQSSTLDRWPLTHTHTHRLTAICSYLSDRIHHTIHSKGGKG